MTEDNFVRLAKVLLAQKNLTERELVEKIKSDVVGEFFAKYPQSKWAGFTVESRIILENAIVLAFKFKDEQWFDRVVYHPQAKDCEEDECWICAIRDCPHHEPLHYHHDGCPSCYGGELKISKIVGILDRDILECWNNRSKDALQNRAMYHRIDAMVLVISKIVDVPFVEVCKKLGIDYAELQNMMGDEKNG